MPAWEGCYKRCQLMHIRVWKQRTLFFSQSTESIWSITNHSGHLDSSLYSLQFFMSSNSTFLGLVPSIDPLCLLFCTASLHIVCKIHYPNSSCIKSVNLCSGGVSGAEQNQSGLGLMFQTNRIWTWKEPTTWDKLRFINSCDFKTAKFLSCICQKKSDALLRQRLFFCPIQ